LLSWLADMGVNGPAANFLVLFWGFRFQFIASSVFNFLQAAFSRSVFGSVFPWKLAQCKSPSNIRWSRARVDL
jgi:hypothetical protein